MSVITLMSSDRATDEVHIFISKMPISSRNPMFDHLLESSHRDDSNRWSNVGFGEEIDQVESVEVNFLHLIWSPDLSLDTFGCHLHVQSLTGLVNAMVEHPRPRQIYLMPLVLQDERIEKCTCHANQLLVLHLSRSNVGVESTPTSVIKFNTTNN